MESCKPQAIAKFLLQLKQQELRGVGELEGSEGMNFPQKKGFHGLPNEKYHKEWGSDGNGLCFLCFFKNDPGVLDLT